VSDRIAQTVVRLYLEPVVEPMFHPDSYGYRPGRSALDAVEACRRRCWSKDWVIDLDIRSFFDSLDHELILKAVAARTRQRWILLYLRRWLHAPLQQQDGTLVQWDRGTPQGSAITPPTHLAMFTLRVGVGSFAGAFADGDAVPDGDRVRADEDVFD
jgi:RNA-directed DNA polymerase